MPNTSHTNIVNRHSNKSHSSSGTSSATQTGKGREGSDRTETTTPGPQVAYSSAALFGSISLEIAQQIHDEFLICKICLDSFDKPKSLACLHTFCQKCIESHISSEVTYNKMADYHHFTCPLCRKRTNLPIGGVRKLPDNFFVSGLAEMLSQTKKRPHSTELDVAIGNEQETSEDDSVCGPLGGHYQRKLGQVEVSGYGECEICGQFGNRLNRGRSSTPSSNRNILGVDPPNQRANSAAISAVPKASSKCLDCNKLLCDQCVKRHKEIRVTKDHAIFNLAAESAIACKEHPEEPVRFYCEACSACVCVLCTFNNHREHEMKSFGEAIQKLRAELRRKVNETQNLIQRTRQRLAVIDDAAEMVHKIERDVRECADKAIDEIHRQEDRLMEQLHSRVGQPTLRIIERAPEWECQLARLESVHAEVVELLEGQDLNVLLSKTDIKEKMSKLLQFEVTGALPSATCPKTVFSPHAICLGQLIFPEDKVAVLPPSIPPTPGQSVSIQTDPRLFLVDTIDRPTTKETASEANVLPLLKQMRHRAINTERTPCVDQETNTRPRGVNISITFGGDEQADILDSYLLAIKDLEGSEQGGAFAAMDNLTRARLRRKLKERWSTIDAPELDATTGVPSYAFPNSSNFPTPKNLKTNFFRRFSDNNAL